MRRIASFFVAAVLATGLVVSGPASAQQRVVVDGDKWLSATPEARRVFLAGAANKIALESAYSKRDGTPQAAAGAMAAKAVEGMTLDQISERITRWYEANPGRRNVPVMGVIWFDIVAPGASE
jgi:hypothetical protein